MNASRNVRGSGRHLGHDYIHMNVSMYEKVMMFFNHFWFHLLRSLAEQHLDKGQGCWVQLLQLLLLVAHIELRNVEECFLLVLPQER